MNQKVIIAQMEHWKRALSQSDSQDICALYDDQASLWGTFSDIRCDSKVLRENYFNQLFAYDNRRVEFHDVDIDLYESFAISRGRYTFSWQSNENRVEIAARFSFVYHFKANQWKIIEHHSSKMPMNN